MKKALLSILLFLFLASSAICQTYVYYRLSSGEVEEISTSSKIKNALIFGEVINPTMPDGTAVNSPSGDPDVLGYAKIYGGGVVRNATQGEINTFSAARIDDRNIIQADEALKHLQNDPKLRRIMIAFAAILVNEINTLRQQHGLADRTLQQLKTAIENRIDKDD